MSLFNSPTIAHGLTYELLVRQGAFLKICPGSRRRAANQSVRLTTRRLFPKKKKKKLVLVARAHQNQRTNSFVRYVYFGLK
jgi:hypothetical protein